MVLEMSTGPKFPARKLFLQINILQNLYNDLNYIYFLGGGKGAKILDENFVKCRYNCNYFIRVQSQILNLKEYFQNFGLL